MTTETVDTSANADATQTGAPAPAPAPAPAATPAPAPAPPTALTSTEPDQKPPAAWPENWREQYSKGDEKLVKQLGRYASPEAALDALFAAQKRISQGELGPKKPGKDASPEELTAYREANGVPEKPEQYFAELPNGLVIGEDDKALFESFGTLAHAHNVPKEFVQGVADWYYKEVVEEGEQARFNADKAARMATEDELRQEYGPEYRAHINGIQNLLNSLPGDAGKILAEAQTSDGISLFNNPAVVRAMVHLVNEVNPTASVIPGGTNITSIDDRLKAIAELQAKDPKKYYADDIQQEELRLLQAKEKLQARA